MKLIHTADLHLGKQFYGFSILADQEHILSQIIHIAETEHADGVLIAGDIFDTPVASRAAVDLLNTFLTSLANRQIAVFLVSGNHDSPERIHYGSSLMDTRGIYISGIYDEHRTVRVVTRSDTYGLVHICLLPYLDPATVRSCERFADCAVATFDDAVRAVLRTVPFDPAERCVLVAHQFFAGVGILPVSSESERVIIGGIEQVDTDVLVPFDYAALGHLHMPQKVGSPTIRYAGSPLKYSPSEYRGTKSVTVVELFEKGNVTVRQVPLTPLHDLRILTGTLADLTRPGADAGDPEDYMVIRLTDTVPPPDAMSRLRSVYPRIIRLEILAEGPVSAGVTGARMEDLQRKSDLELFEGFFAEVCGRPMTEFQQNTVAEILQDIAGGTS